MHTDTHIHTHVYVHIHTHSQAAARAVTAGDCGQYLRGGVGILPAWDVVWDQRSEGPASATNLQDHQVCRGTLRALLACCQLPYWTWVPPPRCPHDNDLEQGGLCEG